MRGVMKASFALQPALSVCGGVRDHSSARRWPGHWPLRHCLRRRSLAAAASLRQNSVEARLRVGHYDAASVVDQLLTNVRGQASLLFYGFRLRCICAPRFEQFDRHLREHRLFRATVFPSSSRCARLQADSSSAKGGVSVIGRNAGFEFALSAPFVV
jgi:hypothetical protein